MYIRSNTHVHKYILMHYYNCPLLSTVLLEISTKHSYEWTVAGQSIQYIEVGSCENEVLASYVYIQWVYVRTCTCD